MALQGKMYSLDDEEDMLDALHEMLEIHGVQRVIEAAQQVIEEKEEESLDDDEKTRLAEWAVYLETALSRSEIEN